MAEAPAISTVTAAPYAHAPYAAGYGNDCLDAVITASALSQGFQGVTQAVHTASVNNMKETSDAARDVSHSVNHLGNINLQAIERNGGETRANIDRNAIQTTRDICDVRKEIAEHHGSVLLEMSKQHCDLRDLIRAENTETRQLIQSQALDAAERRAQDLQNELNILRLQVSAGAAT